MCIIVYFVVDYRTLYEEESIRFSIEAGQCHSHTTLVYSSHFDQRNTSNLTCR